jgi:hypothetical protein
LEKINKYENKWIQRLQNGQIPTLEHCYETNQQENWPLTEPGGGVSRMPYAPEGATGIKKNQRERGTQDAH